MLLCSKVVANPPFFFFIIFVEGNIGMMEIGNDCCDFICDGLVLVNMPLTGWVNLGELQASARYDFKLGVVPEIKVIHVDDVSRMNKSFTL